MLLTSSTYLFSKHKEDQRWGDQLAGGGGVPYDQAFYWESYKRTHLENVFSLKAHFKHKKDQFCKKQQRKRSSEISHL